MRASCVKEEESERKRECVDNEQAILIQAVTAFILFGIGRTIYNIILHIEQYFCFVLDNEQLKFPRSSPLCTKTSITQLFA